MIGIGIGMLGNLGELCRLDKGSWKLYSKNTAFNNWVLPLDYLVKIMWEMCLRKNTTVVVLLVQNERWERMLAVKVGMHGKILIQRKFRQYNLEEYSDLLDVRIGRKTCAWFSVSNFSDQSLV